MTESLEEITKCIEWYRTNKNAPPVKLVEIMRVITTNLYVLESHRAEYQKTFETLVYQYKDDGQSVASAVNMANVEVPEIYMLRRVMQAAYEVAGALRTHISFLKSEMNNLN